MKKIYEKVVCTVIVYHSEDVIRTSDQYEGEMDWDTLSE